MNTLIKRAENEITLIITWQKEGEEKINSRKEVKLDREEF
jgi:hypothetical protein